MCRKSLVQFWGTYNLGDGLLTRKLVMGLFHLSDRGGCRAQSVYCSTTVQQGQGVKFVTPVKLYEPLDGGRADCEARPLAEQSFRSQYNQKESATCLVAQPHAIDQTLTSLPAKPRGHRIL